MPDQTFGERLRSCFDSAEQHRLAHSLPAGSAGLPSAEELNAINHRAHAGAGASGQTNDIAVGGEGGQSGVNRRGGMLEAKSDDLSQGFANELRKIPERATAGRAQRLSRRLSQGEDACSEGCD